MKRVSLSQSQCMRSSTLQYSGEQGSADLSLKALSYQIIAVLKSLSQVQIMPINQLISATLLESSPYCYSRSFKAFYKIYNALGSSPCNLYKMPMLQRQSPANCPLMFADFLKHSIAFLKKPSSAQQQPIRKKQLEASQESAPKKLMMILVQSTQQAIQSIPIAQNRLPMQEIRLSFFCKKSQYFSLLTSFCLLDGISVRSSIIVFFYLMQFSSYCLALFLSLSNRQVLVSRHTVAPQSSQFIGFSFRSSCFLYSPTNTFASSRHQENCLWLKFQQQLFLIQSIFFSMSSAGALAVWHWLLWVDFQCSNWWSLLQQKVVLHWLHWKSASLSQTSQVGMTLLGDSVIDGCQFEMNQVITIQFQLQEHIIWLWMCVESTWMQQLKRVIIQMCYTWGQL